MAKAEIGGRHVRRAMGQQGQARQGAEGFALGQFGLDRLDGAIAGADEQFGDAIGGEFVEIGRKFAEFFDDAHRGRGHGTEFPGERQTLAARLSRPGIDDETGTQL